MKKVVLSGEIRVGFLNKITEREGQYGPYLMWEFLDREDVRYVGFTENVILPGNRLWTWLLGLGYYLKEGDTFDFNSLGHVKCNLYLKKRNQTVVFIYQEQKPSNQNTESSEKSTNIKQSNSSTVKEQSLTNQQVEELFS